MYKKLLGKVFHAVYVRVIQMINEIIIGGAILLVAFTLVTWLMVDSFTPEEKRTEPRNRRRRKKQQAEILHFDKTHKHIEAAWEEVLK